MTTGAGGGAGATTTWALERLLRLAGGRATFGRATAGAGAATASTLGNSSVHGDGFHARSTSAPGPRRHGGAVGSATSSRRGGRRSARRPSSGGRGRARPAGARCPRRQLHRQASPSPGPARRRRPARWGPRPSSRWARHRAARPAGPARGPASGAAVSLSPRTMILGRRPPVRRSRGAGASAGPSTAMSSTSAEATEAASSSGSGSCPVSSRNMAASRAAVRVCTRSHSACSFFDLLCRKPGILGMPLPRTCGLQP